jgi:hypothetical protein
VAGGGGCDLSGLKQKLVAYLIVILPLILAMR